MKKIFGQIILILALFLTPKLMIATAAPSGLVATNIDPNNQSALLSWDDDVTVNQWYIYLGGNLTYQPFRNQTGSVPGPRRTFTLTALPKQNYVIVTMRALAPAQPISAESAPLTVASAPSIIFILNPPGQAVAVTGSFSPATYSSTTGVSMTADTSNSSATRNTLLTVIAGAVSSTGKDIPYGSDAVLPIYTTASSSVLPSTPRYLSQYGPGYEFGACTTCTAGARFMVESRYNSSFITALACGSTMTTGVQGDTMCFLTPAARTRTTLFNPTASGQVLRFLEWASATPPEFDSESLRELTPGAQVTIIDCLPYLHVIAPGGTPVVPPSVEHVTDTPWSGNSYP